MESRESHAVTKAFRAAISGAAMAFAGLFATAAAAQTTMDFNDFQARVNEGAARIGQYQQVLQNPDMRVQYEAVKLLLKSGDPALERIAKEHALFSTNPVLRNSAIEAIFDAGGNLRIQVSAQDENSAKALDWLGAVGGTHDGKTGSFVFTLQPKTETCWPIAESKGCALRVSGTTVQFTFDKTPYANMNAQASLTLGPDGVLRGRIFTQKTQADAAIDLKE